MFVLRLPQLFILIELIFLPVHLFIRHVHQLFQGNNGVISGSLNSIAAGHGQRGLSVLIAFVDNVAQYLIHLGNIQTCIPEDADKFIPAYSEKLSIFRKCLLETPGRVLDEPVSSPVRTSV